MRKISIADEIQSISEAWQWYDDTRSALILYEQQILSSIISGNGIPGHLRGMTVNEVQTYFRSQTEELENLTGFTLISATEATLRVDYLKRVYGRKKDAVSRAFRKLYKERGLRARLREDILGVWAEKYPTSKSVISDFRGAMNFRDWVSHGRYWYPRLGREYRPESVFAISDSLLNAIPLIT